jgi:hypothetical protein
VGIGDNVVVGAGGELLDYGGGEHLLDFISLRLIDKCRNREHSQVRGQQIGVACGVVTASSAEGAYQRQKTGDANH